jgi:hypothetical protein
MRQLPPVGRHDDVVESLRQFLNTLSVASAATLYCFECGSLLSYLQTQFWLQGSEQGSEQGWNIRLPYCPDCHPVPVRTNTLVA